MLYKKIQYVMYIFLLCTLVACGSTESKEMFSDTNEISASDFMDWSNYSESSSETTTDNQGTSNQKENSESSKSNSKVDESYIENSSDSKNSVSSSEIVSSQYNTSYEYDNSLWERKMVALTFDDGPVLSDNYLLDMLEEKGVKATFFLIGKNMVSNQDIVKRIISDGHDLGYHSYDSLLSSSSSLDAIEKDFIKGEQLLEQISPGSKFIYYRNHGGQISANLKQGAKNHDWRIIGWSNYKFDDSIDSNVEPMERIETIFAENNSIRNGEIFLIHPRNENVVDGIALLIDRLREEGFEVVSVSELMQRMNGGVAGIHYSGPIF